MSCKRDIGRYARAMCECTLGSIPHDERQPSEPDSEIPACQTGQSVEPEPGSGRQLAFRAGAAGDVAGAARARLTSAR